MKALLYIVVSLFFCVSSFGQEPGHDIEFVFVDSTGTIITPDIWVKSKIINLNTMKVDESELHYLKIDSIPIFQFGPIIYNKQTYTIFPITGGYWLDLEYNIELSFNNKVMNLNLITEGGSLRDTIEFKDGNFVYLNKDVSFGQKRILHTSKLIDLEPKQLNNFCSLNCIENVTPLDSNTRSLILKSSKSSFPKFLIVNNIPLGVLIWNLDENKVSICYFSDEYIEILRQNYY
ncbi:MAG: hypothetical protein HND27_11000 [Bacteroidetes bacterium]|nr:hypothetical protein [Bacteroidota bacterium]NOG96290.1 hypothetical protein [Bacteroidota bacterium]